MTNQHYLLYRPNGEIVGYTAATQEGAAVSAAKEGLNYLLVDASVLSPDQLSKNYVSNGVITPRPTNPTTLSGMKLLSVPNPATVTIAGVNPQTVTDGEVDLSFTQPGTYRVVVSSWPMLDATFMVTQP